MKVKAAQPLGSSRSECVPCVTPAHRRCVATARVEPVGSPAPPPATAGGSGGGGWAPSQLSDGAAKSNADEADDRWRMVTRATHSPHGSVGACDRAS